jgi:hypothetical protein
VFLDRALCVCVKLCDPFRYETPEAKWTHGGALRKQKNVYIVVFVWLGFFSSRQGRIEVKNIHPHQSNGVLCVR